MSEVGLAEWHSLEVSGTCTEDLARHASVIACAGLGGQNSEIPRFLRLLSMRLCWEFIRKKRTSGVQRTV
jgi:hypothetical protein